MLKEPEAFFPWFSWKREGFGSSKALHSTPDGVSRALPSPAHHVISQTSFKVTFIIFIMNK